MGRTSAVLGALLIPLLAWNAAAQGLSFEVTGGKEGKGEKISYMPGKLRVERMDGDRVTIVRVDKEMIYTIDPANKTYRQVTFAQLADMARQGRGMAGQRTGSDMKPDRRREKENEERGGSQGTQSGAGAITVSPTQVQQNVNGYNCTKYVVTRGSEESTVWATKDIPEYSSMKSDLQKMASRLGDIPAARGILQVADRIDGFPVQREHGGVTEKITDVQRQSIPAQVFELPQGYRQTKGGPPRQGPVRDPDQVK